MTETTVNSWNVLETAHEALRSAVRGVRAGDWDRPTPCAEWTVLQVLQHAAGDQLAYASAITGEPGPSENPFAPSGRLDGDPVDLVENAVLVTAKAWATVPVDASEVPTPLPQGALAPWLATGACALDAAVHAWDIAVATGQDSPLTVELARSLRPVADELVEPLRGFAYAPALAPEAGDAEVAALLRYLGRLPR
ncbi:TIGR03086 family metal-binding protein [Amycolatopsis cynarae]|uniref:TIGR03086 family metal-binding protein n=1 Tax=Amycolatopsis cynarae TaxID=2995223 RepID=A0ABY7AZW6_9PSEU|nr:TIGR03086 family metal-binding protein [Amycolatopsis sp. HUAS 11-8]WAL65580.1 TIGR03086 family metal-binding protein [Amycolatopsis sp. HUAS 11-8]